MTTEDYLPTLEAESAGNFGPDPLGPPPHKSGVLTRLEALGQSSPSTACAVCPAAVWLREGKALRAFCRVMNLIVWSTDEQTNLTDCDGPEMSARG